MRHGISTAYRWVRTFANNLTLRRGFCLGPQQTRKRESIPFAPIVPRWRGNQHNPQTITQNAAPTKRQGQGTQLMLVNADVKVVHVWRRKSNATPAVWRKFNGDAR